MERQEAHAGRVILHVPLMRARHIGVAIVVEVVRQCRHPLIGWEGCIVCSCSLRINDEEVPVGRLTFCI